MAQIINSAVPINLDEHLSINSILDGRFMATAYGSIESSVTDDVRGICSESNANLTSNGCYVVSVDCRVFGFNDYPVRF